MIGMAACAILGVPMILLGTIHLGILIQDLCKKDYDWVFIHGTGAFIGILMGIGLLSLAFN